MARIPSGIRAIEDGAGCAPPAQRASTNRTGPESHWSVVPSANV
jgi:hypothetical protein